MKAEERARREIQHIYGEVDGALGFGRAEDRLAKVIREAEEAARADERQAAQDHLADFIKALVHLIGREDEVLAAAILSRGDRE